MHRLLLSILLCSFLAISAESTDKPIIHPLLILLDEHGIENVAQPNFALSFKLIAGLLEKKTPMLVSANIWHSFLERKEEFAQRKELKKSPENWLWNLYNSINDRLNYWFDLTQEQTHDPVQSKECAVAMVNKEFYDREITLRWKLEKKLPGQTILNSMLCFLVPFNEQEWLVYDCSGYYLFVPVQDCEQRAQGDPLCEIPSAPTSRELSLGLKIDHLIPMKNPLDKEHYYLDSTSKNESLTQVLRSLLITKKEYEQETKTDHRSIILLNGHGFSERYGIAEKRIADLNIAQFHELLQFCEHELSTQAFIYQSCFGSGQNAQAAFAYNEEPFIYSYPILSLCLTDNMAVGQGVRLILPNKQAEPLEMREIYQENSRWQLKLENETKLEQFFKDIAEMDFNQNDLEKIWSTCRQVMNFYWGNIPQLRCAGSPKFITVYPGGNTKLSDMIVALHQAKEMPFTIKTIILLLLESRYAPLTIEYDRSEGFGIASIFPGKANHYIQKVNAPRLGMVDFLTGFFSLEGLCVEKHFLIDELVVALPKNMGQVTELLGVTDSPMTLKNVLIKTEQDYLLRVFFQTEKGGSFMALVRKMDKARHPSFSSLRSLSEKAAEKYLSYYQHIKEELLSSSTLSDRVDKFKEKFRNEVAIDAEEEAPEELVEEEEEAGDGNEEDVVAPAAS